MTKNIAIIGGTDSSGGSGIGADLATIADQNCVSHPVISAITLQNSKPAQIHAIPTIALKSQLSSLSALSLDAIKIGMLPDENSVLAVFEFLKNSNYPKVILDPIRYSSSGIELISAKGWDTLRKTLVPLVDLLTPNINEARLLLDIGTSVEIPPRKLAEKCLKLGCSAIMLKGGHANDPDYSTDLLLMNNKDPQTFNYPRIKEGTKVRGTGCRLATAIACQWSVTNNLETSVFNAGKYLQNYIRNSVS